MNDSWKDALWVSMFEIRKTKKMALYAVPLVVGYALCYITLYSEVNNIFRTAFFELIFVAGMFAMPFLIRTKDYALKKIKGDFWGTPFFNFMLELPVPEKTLIKSRFITYFIQAGIMQALVLVIFYIGSGHLQEELSLGEFILFALFWWMFSQSMGFSFPASEVGRIYTKWLWIGSYLLIAFFLAAFVAYYYFMDMGFLESSIFLVKQYPIMTMLISFVLLVLNGLYCYKYALKWLAKNNYL